MKHKLGSRLLGEISITSDMQMTPPLWQKKSLLMKVKEEGEKVSLKLNIQKTKIMASCPITSWQMDGEAMETVTDFFFGAFELWCWSKFLRVPWAARRSNQSILKTVLNIHWKD